MSLYIHPIDIPSSHARTHARARPTGSLRLFFPPSPSLSAIAISFASTSSHPLKRRTPRTPFLLSRKSKEKENHENPPLARSCGDAIGLPYKSYFFRFLYTGYTLLPSNTINRYLLSPSLSFLLSLDPLHLDARGAPYESTIDISTLSPPFLSSVFWKIAATTASFPSLPVSNEIISRTPCPFPPFSCLSFRRCGERRKVRARNHTRTCTTNCGSLFPSPYPRPSFVLLYLFFLIFFFVFVGPRITYGTSIYSQKPYASVGKMEKSQCGRNSSE